MSAIGRERRIFQTIAARLDSIPKLTLDLSRRLTPSNCGSELVVLLDSRRANQSDAED